MSYSQFLASAVETMPRECYEPVQGGNGLHITDLGINYLSESICAAHLQADHCMDCKKLDYKREAKQLAERIVFNEDTQRPQLKPDLSMSDLATYNQDLNLFLSYNGDESRVVSVVEQKKANPMAVAGYFE